MIKRTIGILLTAVLLFGVLTCAPVSVFAAEDCNNEEAAALSDTADKGKSLNSKVNKYSTGEESVTVGDFTYSIENNEATLTRYNGSASSVEIPTEVNGYPVTCIGEYALHDCNIVSVTLPDSITNIGSWSFDECFNLLSITIPDSVTSIESRAFNNCTSLESIIMSSNVISIGECAFCNCTKLKSINLPESLISIGEYAFLICDSLSEVTVPKNVKNWNDAFSQCNGLSSVMIENGVTDIADYAFDNCIKLKKITIPDSVTKIGEHSFDSCICLEDITLPDSVTSIGDSAFLYCTSLTKITIPDSVTRIGVNAFYGCDNVTLIVEPASYAEKYAIENAIPYKPKYNYNTYIKVTADASLSGLVVNAVMPSGVSMSRSLKDGSAVFTGVDDSVQYKIQLLNSKGRLIAEKTGVTIVDGAAQVDFRDLRLHKYTLNLTDENGAQVKDYSVKWYVDGSNDAESSENIVTTLPEGASVLCKITLGSELKKLYDEPDSAQAIVGVRDGEFNIALKRAETKNVRIKVTDAQSNPISDANVSIVQHIDAKLNNAENYTTDSSGVLTVALRPVETTIKAGQLSYYTNTWSGTPDGSDINIVLKDISGVRLTPEIKTEYIDSLVHAEANVPVADNLSFSIKNVTADSDISEFSYSDGTITIPYGNLHNGDTIEVSAVDSSGAFTDAKTSFVYSEGLSSFELNVKERGIIKLDYTSENKNNIAIIFNSNGDYVDTVNLEENKLSSHLIAGEYTAVLIGYSQLIYKPASYSDLLSYGLSKNTDFIERNVTVKNCEAAEIKDVNIPRFDEGSALYIDSDKSYITVSPRDVSTNRYANVIINYSVSDKFSSSVTADSIVIRLPAGVELSPGIMVDGFTTKDYEYSNDTITIPVSNNSGKIAFAIKPVTYSESFMLSADITLYKNGVALTQPVGYAEFGMKESFTVPQKIGTKNFNISGKVAGRSTVDIYVDSVLQTTVKATQMGSFSAEVSLDDTFSHSFHTIYFEVKDSENNTYRSKNYTVEYEVNCVYLESIYLNSNELYNIYGTGSLSYTFVPGSTFTYVAQFFGNADKLSNVNLVAKPSSGKEIIIPLTRVGNTNKFSGSYTHNSSNIPASLRVTYGCDTEEKFDSERFKDAEGKLDTAIQEYNDVLESYNDALSKVSGADLEEYQRFVGEYYGDLAKDFDELSILLQDDSEYAVLNPSDKMVYYYKNWIDSSKTESDLIKEGYERIGTYNSKDKYYRLTTEKGFISANLSDNSFVSAETYTIAEYNALSSVPKPIKSSTGADITDNPASLSYEDVVTGIDISFSILENVYSKLAKIQQDLVKAALKAKDYAGKVSAVETRNLYSSNAALAGKIGKVFGVISSVLSIAELTNLVVEFRGKAKDYNTAVDIYNELLGLIGIKTCVQDVPERAYILTCINAMKTELNNYKIYLTYKIGSSIVAISSAITLMCTASPIALGIGIAATLSDVLFGGIFDGMEVKARFDTKFNEAYKYYLLAIERLNKNKCSDDEPDIIPTNYRRSDPNGGDGENGEVPINGIVDPSGYVYEAVESNRLEGVTTTVYYSPNSDGSNAEIWDAEDFDQRNPLVTDYLGQYAWFVPEGYWQVKYEKDGYETAYSDWLPVPPPQLEVNIPMKSLDAPEVKAVKAYKDAVNVIFTQYINVSDVKAKNITVTYNGERLSGIITPQNAEKAPDGKTYATIFAFSPDNSITLNGEVDVKVSDVQNYAGAKMDNSYTCTALVQPRLESIICNDELTVNYSEPKSIKIQVQPADAAANKKIDVKIDNPTVLSANKYELVADENGEAELVLSALLPGKATITFSIEDENISAVTVVNCTNEESKTTEMLDDVKASVASGSTVKKGTAVTLTSTNPDAKIYYTLDMSCPCQIDNPARILYTSPIVINEDTAIIAYAVLEGYSDSRTVLFAYNLDTTPAPKLNKKSVSLKAGKTCSLKVTNGKVKSWKSSNSKVALVTSKGKVTALKKGTAKITATLTTGKKLTCKVKVTTNPIIKINKKAFKNKTYYSVKKGKCLTVTVTGKASGVNNVYKTSNKKIAKITTKKKTVSTVKIKGLKKGKTTVTLKVNGVSFKIKVRVK